MPQCPWLSSGTVEVTYLFCTYLSAFSSSSCLLHNLEDITILHHEPGQEGMQRFVIFMPPRLQLGTWKSISLVWDSVSEKPNVGGGLEKRINKSEPGKFDLGGQPKPHPKVVGRDHCNNNNHLPGPPSMTPIECMPGIIQSQISAHHLPLFVRTG